MALDYYSVLNLTRDCCDLDIKKAYRKLALEYFHERKLEELKQASEAYEVLSEPCRRAIYDQFGEAGLKKGIPTKDGFIVPYIYHGDSLKTIREFFGVENPYEDLLNLLVNPLPLFTYKDRKGIKKKEPTLERMLELSLYEVFHGGVKKMKIQHRVFIDDSETTTEIVEQILTIPIKPGLPAGTKFVFKEAGDQGHTIIAADVVFTTIDKIHPVFNRVGENLVMEQQISLQEAMVGTTIILETLDYKVLRIPITEVVSPDYQKVIKGEGMPLVDDPNKRGNLIINFLVIFPKYLSKNSKTLIKKALSMPSIKEMVVNEK
uniref:J domain-containing protein n=1 Tax=Clastoptera arizonana TaxID=38151 RepID=A0A1B6E7B2_9HEMI